MNTLSDWMPVYIGLAFAVAAVVIGLWLKLRRLEYLGESPPQAEKLLRRLAFISSRNLTAFWSL
jgi:hypothetical protein